MRLIDADVLMAECNEELEDESLWLDEDTTKDYAEGNDEGKRTIMAIIDEAPTIEPKYGEWIDKGWKGDWQFETDGRGNCWYEYKCSECGYIKRGSKSNYCPNCGAKMKGI